ncbi:restriction endonuclease subunit S [Lactobacillus delbrueckii]|jgi:type I restriction enzyme S subunit|uniref:restriction endonuclease subunit S n=7 Tax=Bacilli TaxID=91061 RepID=UPI0001EC3207|nr:restriction endonuclease subunit S [Lactobacillus delbrueckii]ADQ61013.1 Putative type-I specificity determinant subunit [Lactobacillus delbrueckii subsp. bulgaricus ND02]RXS48297.1 restriction endonuclease subunit S [Lactobacillus delbrueckii subsp. bulgaricus]UBV31442.1 restriction endonuclease subunit S [Lactobacillus delbrueckii subsp. lactis]WRV88374.1 restriction endonuclease subunit S [Lactobacillus delbrueckii subsp. bulgaricus]
MKDEKKVPKLRFKGFTDDWEQRKLGDVANFSKGTGYSKSDLKGTGSPIILYGRLYTKYETIIRNVDSFVVPKSGSVFSKGGEVIVPGSGETAEDISIASVVEPAGILLGGDLNIIYPNSDLDPTFLAITISNGKPHFDMARRAQGKSIVHLHNADLKHISLKTPNLSEQKRISKIFEVLDQTITLHEEKKHQLESLKSALLQKMFANKNGYPAVRFEGFSNEWEHCKLGDVADITTGSRNHQDSVTDGKYPFFVRSDKVERLNEYDFDTKAILVPGDGRIGEIFHYYNGKFALHQRVYKVDNFNGINELFLLGLFKYSFKEHALRLNAQGTVPSLRLPMFTNWSISVPMITEQKRIGVFFQKLEQTISLYDHKLELLKKVKRSMLQAMFI